MIVSPEVTTSIMSATTDILVGCTPLLFVMFGLIISNYVLSTMVKLIPK